MRLLDFIKSSDVLQAQADHQIVPIKRGTLAAPSLSASMIISHLSVNWRMLPFFVTLKSRHPKTHLVHIEHTYSKSFFQNEVRSQGRFLTLLRTTYSLFNTVVSVSKAQGQWFQAQGLVTPRKHCIIPPCVSLDVFLELPLPKSTLSIGAIGRLGPEKGFDLLIKAFITSQIPNTKLHIYGDGPERAYLEECASSHPDIIFHGFIKNPVKAMENIDIVAIPSKRETYGLVALEAMAAGRTVLVSGVDGLRDHIENGAVKVREPTIDGWVEALKVSQSTNGIAQRHARKRAQHSQRIFFENWFELIEMTRPEVAARRKSPLL